MTTPTSVYQARGITKVYRMGEVEVHALRGVDLDLYEGEFIVFLGPSGSGKSTLLNILGGLDVPTAGTVMYREQDLTKEDDTLLTMYRRNHVGFVFQFYNLIPSLTARENVALVTEIAKNPMIPQEALEDMVPMMLRYTTPPRTEMDLADASLVWLAEDTGVVTIMTLEVRDFSRYRLADGRAFEIL